MGKHSKNSKRKKINCSTDIGNGGIIIHIRGNPKHNGDTSMEKADWNWMIQEECGRVHISRSRGKNYAAITRDGKTVYIHRLIMEEILKKDIPPNYEVDHINRDKLDNRRANLRIVPAHINRKNIATYKNKKTPKNIYFDSRCPRCPYHWAFQHKGKSYCSRSAPFSKRFKTQQETIDHLQEVYKTITQLNWKP